MFVHVKVMVELEGAFWNVLNRTISEISILMNIIANGLNSSSWTVPSKVELVMSKKSLREISTYFSFENVGKLPKKTD